MYQGFVMLEMVFVSDKANKALQELRNRARLTDIELLQAEPVQQDHSTVDL